MSLAGMNAKPDEPGKELASACIDVDQFTEDSRDLMEHKTESDFTTRCMAFTRKYPQATSKTMQWIHNHPVAFKAGLVGAGLGVMAGRVAADTAFGINTTEIDDAFSLMNDHILPDVGKTVSALPSVIIPLVILIVLIMILFIVPELMGTLLDAVSSAIKGALTRSR